ncbi:PilZ domain-containing protein [Pelagibius sp. Alg239-R121]|uniref:PilZ domain-containing protein n=1 Tax=Pelagibius sp. Alg239-R121 TaxID=2993448 RepID=UPI0024A6603F|nr:PilZ domain-containing protein [Pelagibius sp. Alg239-R121]
MVANKQQIDGSDALSLVPDDDRRNYKRAYVVVSGRVSSDGDHSVDCVVLDLSANGAKVRFEEPVMSDEILKITLAGAVEFEVEVAWTNGVFAGLKFLDTPAKVAGVLAGILPDGCLEF